jgi:DNA repair protein RecO (recombination protein O)
LPTSAPLPACRGGPEERAWRAVPPAALSALRYIARSNPRRLFSFTLDSASLAALGEGSEAFLITQLDRPFGTLDFYRQLLSLIMEQP